MKIHLPYYDDKTSITVRDRAVTVKPYQSIVWVSVLDGPLRVWDPRTPKFPAILDIGNNHNFAISEEHLVQWAGIQPASLKEVKRIRDKGQRIPLRAVSVWLHTDGEPLWLYIDEGIAVYETDGPRLPTLGLRALTNNRLRALIHGDEKRAIVRTPPPWYWPF